VVEDERDAPSGEMPASRTHMTFLSECPYTYRTSFSMARDVHRLHLNKHLIWFRPTWTLVEDFSSKHPRHLPSALPLSLLFYELLGER
jgi:hypothetical protein